VWVEWSWFKRAFFSVQNIIEKSMYYYYFFFVIFLTSI
jgi:hypothetical protein